MNPENPERPTPPPNAPPNKPTRHQSQQHPANEPPPTSGFAIGALICGLLALLLIPTVIGAPLLATIAIVLALVHLLSKRRTSGRTLSIIGLVCSLIAIAGAVTIGMWALNKGREVVHDVTELTGSMSNTTAIIKSIENLPVDDAEAAAIAKNLNTEIDAPSLENIDIGSLFSALSNPNDPAAMSNLNALVEGISQDQTLQQELDKLGLEGLGNTLENFGAQFQELNELLAE